MLDALNPLGTTLVEWHHPCCQRSGLQLPETEQGRAGFHPRVSLCPFGDAVASFWGRMQLAAEPPPPGSAAARAAELISMQRKRI